MNVNKLRDFAFAILFAWLAAHSFNNGWPSLVAVSSVGVVAALIDYAKLD